MASDRTNDSLHPNFHATLLDATGASSATEQETIQSLWSGYGKIARYSLQDAPSPTVIVKHIQFQADSRHPRGWNTDISHQRKLHSYQVESHWYESANNRCPESARTPRCLAVDRVDDQLFIVLEDLDAAGYPRRPQSVTEKERSACIQWLAHFHAFFLGDSPNGLWQTGTYWHLDTRPDELEALDDFRLKKAAPRIDALLSSCPYQTIVHGDAKLANFCFNHDGSQVAAVDFQYVGGGCGMKDLAYFVGSCLDEDQCARYETEILDLYFSELQTAVERYQKPVQSSDVEVAWRPLFPVAWTDFHRFLKGWSPGHWKLNTYSEKTAAKVLDSLQ